MKKKKRIFREPPVWTPEMIKHYAVAVELCRVKNDLPKTIKAFCDFYSSNRPETKVSISEHMERIGVKASHLTAYMFDHQSDVYLGETRPNYLKLRGAVYYALQADFNWSQK